MPLAKKLYLFILQTISDIQLVVILCGFLLSLHAAADVSREVNVTEENGIYRIEINKKLDVSANYVRDILSDIVHIYRLNPSIIESEILASQVCNETWVRTKILTCVPTFCREVERVDAIRTLPSGGIQSEIIPELSDFSSGKAVWKVTSLDDGRTHLHHQASIEPRFYIPPIVGIHIVKKEFIMTFDRIEHIARINAERERSNDPALNRLALQEKPKPCKKSLNSNYDDLSHTQRY